MGFLMKDSLYVLCSGGDRDSLGAERAVFVRDTRVQCGWGNISTAAESNQFGTDARDIFLAIIPPLDREPYWVEHAGKVYRVKDIKRFSGFGTDHWELVLEEYAGRFEIK
ncbi:MAG: hypothetical protein ACPL68_05970 [Candidatus Hydrothermia bacterium]